MMRYVKLWADTDFCGTYDCAAFAYKEEDFCENLLNLNAELFGETVFDSCEHLAIEEINRADYETEEEYNEVIDEAAEDYMSHCYCGWEEITYEEFVELGGDPNER